MIAIWYFFEQNEQDCQNHVLESLMKYFITSGADIKIFTNLLTENDNLPRAHSIHYFENKYKCLLSSETLIVLGKIPNIESLNEIEISEIIKTGLIIDCSFNFSLKCFAENKINYICF